MKIITKRINRLAQPNRESRNLDSLVGGHGRRFGQAGSERAREIRTEMRRRFKSAYTHTLAHVQIRRRGCIFALCVCVGQKSGSAKNCVRASSTTAAKATDIKTAIGHIHTWGGCSVRVHSHCCGWCENRGEVWSKDGFWIFLELVDIGCWLSSMVWFSWMKRFWVLRYFF